MTKTELDLLERIAGALEKIAELQEEALDRKVNPAAFRTRYRAAPDVEGGEVETSDEELAKIERKDRERLGTMGVEVTDEEILEGEE